MNHNQELIKLVSEFAVSIDESNKNIMETAHATVSKLPDDENKALLKDLLARVSAGEINKDNLNDYLSKLNNINKK